MQRSFAACTMLLSPLVLLPHRLEGSYGHLWHLTGSNNDRQKGTLHVYNDKIGGSDDSDAWYVSENPHDNSMDQRSPELHLLQHAMLLSRVMRSAQNTQGYCISHSCV